MAALMAGRRHRRRANRCGCNTVCATIPRKTRLNLLVGTPLGHSRRFALISFNYCRYGIAMVERRERSRSLRDRPRRKARRSRLARATKLKSALSALHPPLVRGRCKRKDADAEGRRGIEKREGCCLKKETTA
jgi:hypothetical protein